jgi:hypothetical protein
MSSIVEWYDYLCPELLPENTSQDGDNDKHDRQDRQHELRECQRVILTDDVIVFDDWSCEPVVVDITTVAN